jgi:hypothetical protein
MVLYATFNNISLKLWLSILWLEEKGENHWPVVSQWQTSSRKVVWDTPRHNWDLNSQL